MDTSTLWPAPDAIAVDHITADHQSLTLIVHTRQRASICPSCGKPSERVHSRYRRTLADLPWHGVAIQLRLQTRRFFCTNTACSQHIFTERLPNFAQPYARRTVQLQEIVHLIGLALGGRAGAQLAQDLGLNLQRDTLLRLVKKQPCFMAETPRVLGVDDFAFRRGHHYGTILIDLEKHRVVDLLRDREAQTFATWLRTHPGVEIISRDRGPAYAEGARQGAPEALQVADRWHLLKNLVEMMENLLLQEHRAVKAARETLQQKTQISIGDELLIEPAKEVSDASLTTPSTSIEPTQQTIVAPHPVPITPIVAKLQLRLIEDKQQRRERHLSRYEEVTSLYQEGHSLRGIAHLTGRSRKTVRRYILAEAFPERAARPSRATKIQPFLIYLQSRWDAGCHNATELYQEIRAQGYTGKITLVRNYLQAWRSTLPLGSKRNSSLLNVQKTDKTPTAHGFPACQEAENATTSSLPSVRLVLWWLLRPDEQLSREAHVVVEQLCESSSVVRRARELALWFFRLVRERRAEEFGAWIEAAKETGLPCLRGFAQKLLSDRAAVVAGLSEPWSNGQTEGQVNRLKLLKRQMYGRAGFNLLKARVLASR